MACEKSSGSNDNQARQNYGFSEGYNRAIKDAEYEYIVLLNSDVEVTPDWWKPMLSFMEKNPDAGAIQPKILSFAEKQV